MATHKEKKFFGKELDAVLGVAEVALGVADAALPALSLSFPSPSLSFPRRRESSQESGHPSHAHLGTFQITPITQFKSGNYQPRQDFAAAALEELAASIKQHGILQPILARKRDNFLEIIAGERRWLAAKIAGLTDIPTIICDISDMTALALGLIENIQRQDLNCIEEAHALQRLINEFSMTHEKVAAVVGKSRVSITNLMRLLALPLEIQNLLIQGSLDMGHARALLKLEHHDQIRVAESIVAQKLSVRQTEELVQKIKNNTPATPNAHPAKSAKIISLETELSKKFSTRVNICLGKERKGKLLIHFESISEVEWLLEHLQLT